MRPCNQCRQPVENSVRICDDCRQWNQSQLEKESAQPGSNYPESSEHDPGTYSDYSYAILMGTFSLVITALFALIGLAIHGFDGFVIGGSAGLIIGIVLFSLMIKM